MSDSTQYVLRPQSRPSSRASVRAASPSLSLEDPVSIRSHISSLKHTIRHQQAQLQTLENILHRSSYPVSVNHSKRSSPPISSTDLPSPQCSSYSSPSALKLQRRTSSLEILQSMAGPDSLLPLPKQEGSAIREGVPTDFTANTLSPDHVKRSVSPTRSLSRIPVASVGHARTLAEDGQSLRYQKAFNVGTSTNSIQMSDTITTSTTSLNLPPSPGKRMSFGSSGGNTTKVLADLQAGVINAKNALENTKAQLRLSQRTVAQLTRQIEDLKDGRERLRLENEGLNNVVARKERLLQEVLDRARKAETESAALKTQLKSEISTSKRALREMEAQVHHSTAISQKCEREYVTLRDSITHLSEGWKRDVDRLKKEMRERETKLRKEAEDVGRKYRKLLEQSEKEREAFSSVQQILTEERRLQREFEDIFRLQLDELRGSLQRSEQDSSSAAKTAQQISNELLRLRSLIRAVDKNEDE
ncbi:hypothetical protein ACEPAH_3710 [Sanghuangporus vaninii]